MKKTLILIACMFRLVAADAQESNAERTAAWYKKAKTAGDEAKLSLFFTQMPKGGDLHHHYSGAVYVETYLDWVKEKGYRIDPQGYWVAAKTSNSAITVDSLRKNTFLYRNLLSTWSTQDFYNHFQEQLPPDEHFFNTFSYFGSTSVNYVAGLAEIKKRALLENVQYIETMISSVPVPVKSTVYNERLYKHLETRDEAGLAELFTELRKSLDEGSIDQSVATFNKTLDSVRQGIDDANFSMRFQTYTTRNNDPSTTFIALYAAFKACAANPYLVAVNFVGPENGVVAMKDYWLHMQMFHYFKSMKQFRNVRVALHAGELAMGMGKPEDMGYHIHDALMVAGAERIGHGVDLPFEYKSPEILQYMAEQEKAVEINLVSNEFILGIKDGRHPINLYYDAGVPLVISTDDAGVSRDNLTEQYVLLASRYHFSYRQIKELVFNSITYSFMPEELKAKHKAILTARFAEFERKIANMH